MSHAESNTANREKDVDDAEHDVDRSRASRDVLEDHDPEAIEDANAILEQTPEEEPVE